MTLDDLYDRHGEEMYHFLALRLRSPQDAEDVLQETFCRLARYGPRWAFVRNPRAFVFTILRNEANRFLMRAIRRRDDEHANHETEGGQRPTSGDGTPRIPSAPIELALSHLPDEQKEVIILKIVQGFTFKEIAGICGVSPSTAASRYRYGIQGLRTSMEGKK